MTREERMVKSLGLAQTIEKRDTIRGEKKLANESFKERIGECDEEIAKLTKQVKTGLEERPVECAEIMRWPDKMVDIVRTDTGDIVESRPMRADELQNSIPFGSSEDANA